MNVKPKSLAIVINANHTPELIGMIVYVDRLVFDGEIVDGIRRKVHCSGSWLCSLPDGRKMPRRLEDGSIVFRNRTHISDINLRPVYGLPDAINIDEQLKEPA